MNVLVIEDDAPFARLLGALLNANGDEHHVDRAASLADAVRRLAAGGIDAVVTDLGLPDSKGLATYRAVREHAPGLPVVIVSGGDDDAVALAAVREGADDYLVKGGITDRALRRAVNHATERKRLMRELETALAEVRTLRGLIPICAGCKQIRDDAGRWHQLESYVTAHSNAEFSHGMCPSCATKYFGSAAVLE
jgi:DNA-binding NtrC family response regulator